MVSLYHVTQSINASSILHKGLIPGKGKGVMTRKDRLTYLTDSLEYIRIIAEDIAHWKEYTILQVNISEEKLSPIWWKGKDYKEWTYDGIIPAEDITIYKEVGGMAFEIKEFDGYKPEAALKNTKKKPQDKKTAPKKSDNKK